MRPVRRSDEHLPSSKAVSRPTGGGGGVKKPSGPSAPSRGGAGGKVIDSRARMGGVAGRRVNTPTSGGAAGKKPIGGKKDTGVKVSMIVIL